MREVYPDFKYEVSSADSRADVDASELKDILADLQAAAQGNTPLLDDKHILCNRARAGRQPTAMRQEQ